MTDANTVEVVDAYRRTERDLASHRSEVRGRAFERLVFEGEQDPRVVGEAATLLGLPLEAPLIVVVAEGVPTQDRHLLDCRQALHRAGLPFHFGYMGDELLGIVYRGRRSSKDVHLLLQPLGAWRAGTADIDGLAGTARGVRLARAAIRSEVTAGLRPVSAHWIGAVMSGNEELTGLMASGVLRPLVGLRDRDNLIETLASFLELGSVADVAEQTYRHRNTVRGRLQTVESVTGLRLAKPLDAALLAMATAWLKSVPGQTFWTSQAAAITPRSSRTTRPDS